MIAKNGKIELTPAQLDFCKDTISGFNSEEWQVSLAGRAGSDRRFLRIYPVKQPKRSMVLILWDSNDEDWERFITINDEVSSSLHVLPRIYSVNANHGLILEEDCGHNTLKDFCGSTTDIQLVEKRYQQVLDLLITWQNIQLNNCPEISSRVLDKNMFLWETEYFEQHCVSEYFGLDSLLTPEWKQQRNELASEAAKLTKVCLHRDFQSENIVVNGDEIRFVDYQGARMGAAEYDLASLLFDPYVSVLDDVLRKNLLDYYQEKSTCDINPYTFHIAALQRLCQALGAYGNLSLHKGRETYKKYIPLALHNLMNVLNNLNKYSYLKDIVQKCIEKI